jgi:hypothetical protein
MFAFAGGRTFKRGDFVVSGSSTVRLSPQLAREVAGIIIKKFPLTKYIDAVRL